MGRRKRILVTAVFVTMGFISAQAGAFSVGVLLGSPDRSLAITFWTILGLCFLVANLVCFSLLKLWAEPWARRRLRQL
jgi:hypothetical protein